MANTDPTGYLSIPPDLIRGFSWKQPVRCASTANGTLATAFAAGQTVDGITLATGDRILLKDQTAGAANGIYKVNASGAPTRAFDMDQDLTTAVPAEEVMGALVYVIAGTVNGGKVFKNTNTTTPVLGTTALTFAEFGAGAPLTVKDEGSSLATAATSIDFVGAGVTASGTTAAKTVTIPGGATTLAGLTDVTITTPTLADRLRFDGTNWVNSALRWVSMTAYDPTTGNWLPLVDGSGNQITAEV